MRDLILAAVGGILAAFGTIVLAYSIDCCTKVDFFNMDYNHWVSFQTLMIYFSALYGGAFLFGLRASK